MTRRAERPITIRSDRAARRLALLTRGGRSQVSVIEEALERMPVPPEADAELRARIAAILYEVDANGVPSMAEFDAREYDGRGNPR